MSGVSQYALFSCSLTPTEILRTLLSDPISKVKVATICPRFSAARCAETFSAGSLAARSSTVDDFGTNRKRICEFLLVINSNFGPILHRFWHTATYWLRIVYFSYPSLIRRRRSLSSLWNFRVKISVRKLESWGYSVVNREGCVILTSTVFDWSTRVTDRRTGDSIIARYTCIICCRALKSKVLPEPHR